MHGRALQRRLHRACLLLALLSIGVPAAPAAAVADGRALPIDVDGAIGPATAAYIERAIAAGAEEGAEQ